MRRQPLGDGTVHVAYDLIVANGGIVEEGINSMGDPSAAWALVGYGPQQTWDGEMANFSSSPGVGELQVNPILPEPDLSAYYPENRGETSFKGNRGREGHFGFPRDENRFPNEGVTE